MSGTEILPDLTGASIFQGSLNLKRKNIHNTAIILLCNKIIIILLICCWKRAIGLYSCSIFSAEIIVYNRFMVKDQVRQVIPVKNSGLQGIVQAPGRTVSGSNEYG